MNVIPRPLIILLVEDDPPTRDLYRLALRATGYIVTAVEDGIDALRYVEQRRPDAIVLDLALPRVGGRDVRRELRGRPETFDIPIVIVSGTDTSDLEARDNERILSKPIDPETLALEVDRVVVRARPRPVESGR